MKLAFDYTKELLILDKIFNKDDEDNLRIVGGAVRNFLIKKEINDFDLSTKLTPNESIKLLKENNIKFVPTGIEFGTILAVINKKSFEITSTRKDVKTDGRHAIVEFTKDFELDAERRDFTFNALYLDFKCNLYDYFEGLSDLKNGIVKFIGNAEKRIQEDYLRILRFFRFYCYYGKSLDEDGLKYSTKYKENLKNISGERIKSEMFKILIADNSIDTLKIMQNADILYTITDIEKFSFDKLEKLLFLKSKLKFKLNAELVLASLLNNKDELNKIKEKWKLSNHENKKIYDLITQTNENLYDEKTIKKFIFNKKEKNFIIDLSILNAIINFDEKDNILEDLKNKMEFTKKINAIELPLNGKDLEKANFLNKKEYRKILEKAKDVFIDSNFSMSKAELIKTLKQN